MTIRATFIAAFPEARRISNFLERDYASDGVVVSLDERTDGSWSVDAYFEIGDAEGIGETIRDALGTDAFGALQSVELLPDTDWIAAGLASLKPVTAGRFLIHGRHDRAHVGKGRIAIEIEAGRAFGTGHHATTAGILKVIDRLAAIRRYRRVLDLGTGTGVLAIAIAKMLHVPVIATDIDPLAVAAAMENARGNRVAPFVHAFKADGLAHPSIRAAPFDLIVANILAGPLAELAPAIARALAPNGDLVLSGLLDNQRERVVAAYSVQRIPLVAAHRFDEWMVLHFRRPGGNDPRGKA